MELPAELKKIYRHWKYHVSTKNRPEPEGEIPPEISWFVNERLTIWKRKTRLERPPFTADPTLQKYRFCNTFRELDRQTIEFHSLLEPIRNDFPLWLLNMFYCRMIARPETVRAVGLLSFDGKERALFYERLMNLPRPRYGTPYVFPISAIQKSATPTRELFLAEGLPARLPALAAEIGTWHRRSVFDGVNRLLPLFGFHLSFLWTEVLIDVAYQFPEHVDLFGRFPVGPGARPTFQKLNRSGRDHSLFVEQLAAAKIPTDLTFEGQPLVLSAENWEGIGCEFRKYDNLRHGHGRKRLYVGRKSNLINDVPS